MLTISYPKAGTQQDIVLALLIEAEGNFVDAFRLTNAAKSIAVHSVISKLREDHGWHIVNRCEYVGEHGAKVCHSSYRLPLGQVKQHSNN